MTWRADLRAAIDAIPEKNLLEGYAEVSRAQAAIMQRLSTKAIADASPQAYNAAQVAKKLGRHVSWVRRHQEKLGAIKRDGALLFPESALRRFMNGDGA